MLDERTEEDLQPLPKNVGSKQDFEAFKLKLLAARPWWQKAFDWLDDHLAAAVLIAVGSVALGAAICAAIFFLAPPLVFIIGTAIVGSIFLTPPAFILGTQFLCINTKKEIEEIVNIMETSWDERNSPIMLDTSPFATTNFKSRKPGYPLWMKNMIAEQQKKLEVLYIDEQEKIKSPVKRWLETLPKIAKSAQLNVHEDHLEIEKKEENNYIVFTHPDKKAVNDFSVFMQSVFNIPPSSPIEVLGPEVMVGLERPVRDTRFSIKFFVPEAANLNPNKDALQLFGKIRQAFSTVRQLIESKESTEATDSLKETVSSRLTIEFQENGEIILQSSLHEDQTLYDTCPAKDFLNILDARKEWLNSLNNLLKDCIGPDNFEFKYHLQESIVLNPSDPRGEEHQTNYPFNFSLIIKPGAFDLLLDIKNIPGNNINKSSLNIK